MMETVSEYNAFCGVPPICKCFFGFLICSTLKTEQLPDFNQSIMLKTVHVDMSVNKLTEPPDIVSLHWPLLKSIDLRGNKQLSCSKIMKFLRNNPSLHVYHDCTKEKKQIVFWGNNTWTSPNRHNGTTEVWGEEQENNNQRKSNMHWTTEATVILSEALILAAGLIIYLLHRIISVVRRSFASGLNHLNNDLEFERVDPERLHSLRSSTTQFDLPSATTSEVNV